MGDWHWGWSAGTVRVSSPFIQYEKTYVVCRTRLCPAPSVTSPAMPRLTFLFVPLSGMTVQIQVKGCTHRAMEPFNGFQLLDFNASKGLVALCVHFFVAIEGIHQNGKGVFLFQLNANMLNISFTMGMFSYQNWLKCSVGTLIFYVFQ